MVVGLAVGLSSTLFTALYVWNETRFEHHLPDPDRTYRIIEESLTPNGGRRATSPFPLAETMAIESGGDIVATTRLFNFQAKQVSLYLPEQDARFSETRFFFVDSTYFDVFGGRFIRGDARQALQAPFSLVLTESAARRFFGDADPVGRSVRFEGRLTLTVTAIIPDPEPASHLQADLIASITSLQQMYVGGLPSGWSWSAVWTYVRLSPSARVADMDAILARIGRDRQPEPLNRERTFRLQPVRDIWLHSDLDGEIRPVNSAKLVVLIAMIGFSVLCVATFNNINLAIARSMKREPETAIRKIQGASAFQLIQQFMTESAQLTGVSLLIAAMLVVWGLPVFNQFGGAAITLADLGRPAVLAGAVFAILLVVLLSGIYPAVRASRIQPLHWLQTRRSRESVLVRDVLLILQFAVALWLLSSARIVNRQVETLENTDLGFDHQAVVVLPVANSRLIFFYEEFLARMAAYSGIHSVTATSDLIGAGVKSFDYETEGSASGPVSHPFLFVTSGFEQVFRIPVVAGRPFSDRIASDATEAVMVNESMVRHLGWGSAQEAIGKWVNRDAFRYRVIGVVADFRATDLRGPIGPLMLEMPIPASLPTQIQYIHFRYDPDDEAAVMAVLSELHAEFDPRRLFRPFHLTDELNRQYERESRLGWFADWLSVLAVFVAAMGVFGLANQSAERRRKSVSIHRILGAGGIRVAALLTGRTLAALAIAAFMAFPAWWILAQRWLSEFDVRAAMSITDFITPLAVLAVSCLLALIHPVWNLYRSNPVDSLRRN